MAMSMRCMARMNSSAVSLPSWSMSDRLLGRSADSQGGSTVLSGMSSADGEYGHDLSGVPLMESLCSRVRAELSLPQCTTLAVLPF